MPYPDIQRRSRRGRTSYGGGTSVLTRYFTDYDASLNSYDQWGSAVTLTRVVMDVYPTNGNVGLPTGAPAVTNNVLQTIDFAYSGTLDEIGRNGASYFSGIIANVKGYNVLDLVADFPLDEGPDSTIRINRADPLNNATRFNQPASQDNLFTRVSDGWEMDLWSYGDTVYDGTEPAFAVVSGDIPSAVIQLGWTVRYSSNYNIETGSARFRVADLLSPALTGIGSISGEEVATSATRMSWQTVSVPCIGTSTDTQVKRFLEEA